MPFDIDLDEMMTESVKAERAETQEGAGEGVPSTDAAPSVEDKVASPSTESKTPVEADAGRVRGPDGKFAKADTKVEPDNNKIAADAKIGEAKVSDQTVTTGIQTPVSWSAAAKAEFSKLPLAVQEAVAKREMEVSQGFKQYGEKVKAFEAIERTLAPIMPKLQMQGMDGATYVSRLIAAERALEQNPAEAFKWLAQSYGFDLNQLAGQQPEQAYVDPEIASLRKELAELRSGITQSTQSTQMAVVNEVKQEIERFKSETSPDGTPKAEFWAQVEPVLRQMSQNGEIKDIASAYQEACWRNPEVRAILQARHADALQKKLREEAAAKVTTLRPAMDTNIRGNGSQGMPQGNWDETLREATRAAFGR